MRAARGLVLSVWLGACGASMGGAGTTVLDDPLPSSENQQGGPSSAALGLPMTSSPLADTYIWCADSAGPACMRATAALGALPIKNPANAPPALFMLEDLPDDCTALGMMEIRRRLDVALTLDSSGWRDQGGNQLDASAFPDIYAASGCVTDSAAPVVKIAASSTSPPRLYLVRVWETSSGY